MNTAATSTHPSVPSSSALPPADITIPPPSVEFRYTQTDGFVTLLQELGASLLVSTYQANKLIAIRATQQGISTLVRTFDRPMGLAVDSRRLTIGTRREVVFLRNAPDLAGQIEPAGTHDACFLPRASHVTGDIGIHEVCLAGDDLWLVSTRFSCLCSVDPDYSFVPRWKPPFISQLAAEDRCHLNGLAMVNGQPQFATCLGTTDTRDGWRANKSQGGCVLEIAGGESVTQGLCMPHSPRWHANRLWLLESGTGELVTVDLRTGQRNTVARLPGFTRGLALVGPWAFIGLSRIRATSAMDGVPLAARRDELKCGIAVVDLRHGTTTAFLEFQSAVEEIFDVQLVPGLRFPEVLGFKQDTLSHTFVVPSPNPADSNGRMTK